MPHQPTATLHWHNLSDITGSRRFSTPTSGHSLRMEGLLLMFMTVIVLGVSVAVMYHASHADQLWPFGKPSGLAAVPPAPLEVLTTAEFADYVRRGLEDLTVMLAQAARNRPR